jgi:hypothetical protein
MVLHRRQRLMDLPPDLQPVPEVPDLASRSMFLTGYLISMFNPIYTDLRAIPSW